MPLGFEKEERAKKVIRYILLGGIGAAAVHEVVKGNKAGYFRLTEAKSLYMGVWEMGRQRINQVSATISDFQSAVSGHEVEIDFDDHNEATEEDLAEIESVFIDVSGKTSYTER